MPGKLNAQLANIQLQVKVPGPPPTDPAGGPGSGDPNARTRHSPFVKRQEDVLISLRFLSDREDTRRSVAPPVLDAQALRLHAELHAKTHGGEELACLCSDPFVEDGELVREPMLLACGHLIHKECFQQQIAVAAANTDWPINCWSCRVPTVYRDWAAVLSEAEQRALYEKAVLGWLKQHPECRSCCTPDCPQISLRPQPRPIECSKCKEEGKQPEPAPFFECELCQKKHCDKCGGEYHEDICCHHYEVWKAKQKDIKASEALITSEIAAGRMMKCPNCPSAFEKPTGCNYVICYDCKAPCCWATKKLRAHCGGGHSCH